MHFQNMVINWSQISTMWLNPEVSFSKYGTIWSQILPILGTVPIWEEDNEVEDNDKDDDNNKDDNDDEGISALGLDKEKA